MISRYFTVLGIDPSISHVGLVYGLVDIDTRDFFPLVAKTIVNKFDTEKYSHLNSTEQKAIHTWNMGLKLHRFIGQKFSYHGFGFNLDPDIIVFELANGSNKSFTDASLNCAKGLIGGVFSAVPHKYLSMPSTSKVKTVTGNPDNAIKEQMVAWAVQKYGVECLGLKTEELTLHVRELEDDCDAPFGCSESLSYNEHIADAVAAIEAGLENSRTKKWIKDNAEKHGRGGEMLFMAAKTNFENEKIRLFQNDLPRVRNEVTRCWKEETTSTGEKVLNPCLGSLRKKRWGFKNEAPRWDAWISKENYGKADEYKGSKISEVYESYGQNRSVFFTDAFLIQSIRKLGYVKFLSMFGLFDLSYEARIKAMLKKLEGSGSDFQDSVVKNVLTRSEKRNPEISSLDEYKKHCSEDQRIEDLSECAAVALEKVQATLNEHIQTMHAEEKRFIEESLFILRWFCREDLISDRLSCLQHQSEDENPEMNYRDYYLAEAELLKASLNNALIAQKGAGKIGEYKKEVSEAIGKLIKDFGLEKKARFNAKTGRIEKVIKKKTGPKPKTKVIAPDAPSAPKRGRGRPKGSKNKKTIEREKAEAMRKEKEKEERAGGSLSLAPKEDGLPWERESDGSLIYRGSREQSIAESLDEFLRELDHSED